MTEKYDLDALRAAVEKTRRAPLLLGGNPHQDKADVIQYSHSLDCVRRSLLNAARNGLLDDAALGRAVLPLLDEHIKQAQLAVSERANWSIAQGEWSRARDALLNFRDALVGMKEQAK